MSVTLSIDGRETANRLTVDVGEIIYGADHSMIRLTRTTGDDLMAKAGAAEAAGVTLGDRLDIGWETEHCRALDAS